MIKFCPIRNNGNDYCMTDSCAWWDEEKSQCCILTQVLAATANPPATPVVFQPGIYTTPAVVPNSSGDWVNPNPYTITC